MQPEAGQKFSHLQKILFFPSSLGNLNTTPDKEQRRQLGKIHRIYNQAMHPDMANAGTSKDLQPYVDTIHKAINSVWDKGRPLN